MIRTRPSAPEILRGEPRPSPELSRPVEDLRGVGPSRAAELRRLGIQTLGDLLQYFPRDYQYESEERPIAALRDGQFGIARGEVTAVNYIAGNRRPRFEATLSDESNRLCLTFFNGAYLRTKVHPGLILRARGMVRFFRGLPQMANPKWETVEPDTEPIAQAKLRAIYPASEKLPSEIIERILQANLPDGLKEVAEWYSPDLLARRKIPRRAEAIRAIHQPRDRSQALAARRRFVYDELMAMQLALALSRKLGGAGTAPILHNDKNLHRRILARYPFDLTAGQLEAIWQIVADMKSGKPMKRLLQGDVGSGKTVVALYAMLVAITNKMQAAILAPTEVLAEQHFLTMRHLLRDSKVRIELFTSRTRRKSKGSLAADLAEGRIHLAIGTQALLQEKIEFANLGLIVVDEQHRLGVRQRAHLTTQAQSPHYLVMTATPIPRTLALSYFADFDLSTIEGLPPGRQPIRTQWVPNAQAPQAYAFVRNQIAAGRQAYIVVPQIDSDDAAGAGGGKSVIRHAKQLSAGVLSGLRVAPLHGQMASDEKEKTMADFRAGKIDALVATTVIEVGIDVPNATVMVIEEADRFGLSQLHQIRGRVGRGEHPSHCVLISDTASPAAQARLEALVHTTSGFEIAETDLRLRGPGELFGTRQHGLPEFKLADLASETDLLLQAKQDSQKILEKDPTLCHPHHSALRAMLIQQFSESLGLAQIG
jgi:ATP-dependent DNA helicase RecG